LEQLYPVALGVVEPREVALRTLLPLLDGQASLGQFLDEVVKILYSPTGLAVPSSRADRVLGLVDGERDLSRQAGAPFVGIRFPVEEDPQVFLVPRGQAIGLIGEDHHPTQTLHGESFHRSLLL